MSATVIIPARDAQATITRALEAIAAQDLEAQFEVIVVDDGSRDRTAELARDAPGPVTVIRQPPRGQAAARNLGAARARGALLAFCDADVFPTESWLSAGVRALDEADVVQGRVLPDPRALLGPFDRTLWVTAGGGLWESANLFATRELFDRVGGFSGGIRPRHGKGLAEDVYFGHAAMRLGARTAFCPEALAYHAVFARNEHEYIAERARLRYFPAMARAAPELRDRFFHKRIFLNRRSARLDLALGGAGAAGLLRSRWPLALAWPYLKLLCREARRSPGSQPGWWRVAAVDLMADLVGLAAMAEGSLRHGSVVL